MDFFRKKKFLRVSDAGFFETKVLCSTTLAILTAWINHCSHSLCHQTSRAGCRCYFHQIKVIRWIVVPVASWETGRAWLRDGNRQISWHHRPSGGTLGWSRTEVFDAWADIKKLNFLKFVTTHAPFFNHITVASLIFMQTNVNYKASQTLQLCNRS